MTTFGACQPAATAGSPLVRVAWWLGYCLPGNLDQAVYPDTDPSLSYVWSELRHKMTLTHNEPKLELVEGEHTRYHMDNIHEALRLLLDECKNTGSAAPFFDYVGSEMAAS